MFVTFHLAYLSTPLLIAWLENSTWSLNTNFRTLNRAGTRVSRFECWEFDLLKVMGI